MNAYSFGRTTGRWLVVASAACLVAGHSAPLRAGTKEDTTMVKTAAAPQTSPPKHVRTFERRNLGVEYCLVREVPDSGGGTVKTRLPVIGIKQARPSDWSTGSEGIELKRIPHVSHCGPGAPVDGGDKLHIRERTDGAFDVTIKRGLASATVLSRVFKRPATQRDAYLHALPENCTPGTTGCDINDNFHAYLYVVDARNQAGKGAKLAFIDFFPSTLSPTPGDKCDAERPEKAVKLRTNFASCGLPSWIYDLFGPPALRSSSTFLQTGTGGGYEPPG